MEVEITGLEWKYNTDISVSDNFDELFNELAPGCSSTGHNIVVLIRSI